MVFMDKNKAINAFCNKCGSDTSCIWFKTKDHYLDLKHEQLKEFSDELQKQNLTVSELDYKTIEIREQKKDVTIRLVRHECGPEILFDFAQQLAIAGIIEALKKTLEKTAKKKNETPAYAIYLFQDNRQIQINYIDKTSIKNIFKNKPNK